MADLNETKFSDLRYKQLTRQLKLALLKQQDKMLNGCELSPCWPTLSSIHPDAFDTSVTPSLQSSKIGSEVVSSSNNLKNVLMRRKDTVNGQETMTTSSVKHYRIQQTKVNDHEIMPPPSIIPHSSKCLSDNVSISNVKNIIVQTDNAPSIVNEGISEIISTNVDVNRGFKEHQQVKQTSAILGDCNTKPERIFHRWRVLLNEQYQLIIKGTLDCGKIAHSKPVIRRLSATSVQSVYKHIYHLQGNIIDERNELPEYVRGKFYNGFPDDWENVYQIWRTFVSQGCKLNFRWPTPITDSDDDLKSEITDITISYAQRSNRHNVQSSLQRTARTLNLEDTFTVLSEKCSNDNSSGQAKQLCSNRTNDSFTQTDEIYHSKGFLFSKEDVSRSQEHICNKESVQQNENRCMSQISPKQTTKLKDIIQEDTFKMIINNLADKNCSQEYIHKIIEMLDCLNYVVSYKSENETMSNIGNSSINKKTKGQKNRSSNGKIIPCSLEESFASEPILIQDDIIINTTKTNSKEVGTSKQSSQFNCDSDIDIEYEETNVCHKSRECNSQPYKKFEVQTENDQLESSNSESETYSGVRKIPIQQILVNQGLPKKHHRRRDKKNAMHLKSHRHDTEIKQSANVSNNNSYKETLRDNRKSYDTDISITESEIHFFPDKQSDKHKNVIDKSKNVNSTLSYYKSLSNSLNVNPEMPLSNLHSEILRDNVDNHRINVSSPNKTQTKTSHSFHTVEREKMSVTNDIRKLQKNPQPHFNSDYTKLEQEKENVSHIRENTMNAIAGVASPKTHIVNENAHKRLINDQSHQISLMNTHSQISNNDSHKICKPVVVDMIKTNLNVKLRSGESQRTLQHNSNAEYINEKRVLRSSGLNNNNNNKKTEQKLQLSSTKVASTNDCTNLKSDNRKQDSTENLGKQSTKVISENTKSLRHAKSNEFGTEYNPKSLTAWNIKVVRSKNGTELGVVFEGKLLNEAGHIIHRKFTTGIILQRLSPTLVETVDHEYYQLVGDMNNSKHDIPKELLKQCRNGCPLNLKQFCKAWKSLQTEKNLMSMSQDTSMDTLSVHTSSRGRKIVPPLSYWTGERVTIKDNNLIYTPGNSQESSFTSTSTSQNKISTSQDNNKQASNIKSATKEEKNTKDKSKSDHSKHSSLNEPENTPPAKILPKQSTEKTQRKSKQQSGKKTEIRNKKRVAQRLQYSSSGSNDEEQSVSAQRKRRHNNHDIHDDKNKMMHKMQNADAEHNMEIHNDVERVGSGYTARLRKRQRIDNICDTFLSSDPATLKYSEPYRQVKNITYFRDIPKDDILSDDQLSQI